MSKFKQLQPGEVLSETQYYKVVKKVGDEVQLQTDNGDMVVLNSAYVDQHLTSAAQFSKEEKITKTDLTEKILQHTRTSMTINYNKQVKEADVLKEVVDAHENSTPKEFEKKAKAAVKKGMNGEERTIVGRHYGTRDAGGRIQFIDMNEDRKPGDYDTRQRLVDTRTLNWAIINDVKYVVK